jgi:hypothetical protein
MAQGALLVVQMSNAEKLNHSNNRAKPISELNTNNARILCST